MLSIAFFLLVGLGTLNTINGICDTGYHLPQSATNCTRCPIGHSCDGAVSTACEPGQYQDESGQGYCKNCTQGYHQPDAGSIDCIPCPRGLFCNTTTIATNCPAGEFQPLLGAMSCMLCPAGTYQPTPGSVDCSVCPAGHYCPTGSSTPVKCAPGTTQTLQGQEACEPCAHGHYSLQEGSTGSCRPCPPGSYCPIAAGHPRPCEPGTYSPGGLYQSCLKCPSGYYTLQHGSSACEICPKGHYCNTAAVEPVPCPSGAYQPYEGQSQCIGCPAELQSTEEASESCKPIPDEGCEPGFGRNPTTMQCIACKPGMYSDQNVTLCISCPAGHYCLAQSDKPIPCEQGQFQSRPGQSSCSPCPYGHHCPNIETIDPIPCAQGEFQDKEGETDCRFCPSQTFQLRTAASTCQPCPEGYSCESAVVKPTPGIRNATLTCQHGQRLVDDTHCEACPKGTFQVSLNGTVCEPCPHGHFCSDPARPPVTCPAGTTNGALSQTKCQACEEPTYSVEIGWSTSCIRSPAGYKWIAPNRAPQACPPGTYGPDGITCEQCEDGFFNPEAGRSACFQCLTGHKCPEPGMTEPQECPPGKYQGSLQSYECKPCQFGQKCPAPKSIAQTPCPPGEYQDLMGQKECKRCPDGHYQTAPGQKACIACPAGFMCPDATKVPVECPLDHFEDTTGRIECRACDLAQVEQKTGRKQCETCPAGYRCPETLKNSVGLYRNKRSINMLPRPQPCSPGTYSVSGQTDCSLCAVGHYAPFPASIGCSSCGEGAFCPHPGMERSLKCPTGYAVSCSSEIGCNKCANDAVSTGIGLRSCTSGTEKGPYADCKQDDLAHCAYDQGKCLVDAALNVATNGAWSFIDASIDAAEFEAGLNLDARGQRDLNDARRDLGIAASAAAAQGAWQIKLPDADTAKAAKQGSAAIGTAIRLRKAIEKYLDKSQQGQSAYGLWNAVHDSIATMSDVVDMIGNRGPERWRKVADGWKKAMSKVSLNPTKYFKWAKKMIGRKIPVMCNVLSAMDDDCRHSFKCIAHKVEGYFHMQKTWNQQQNQQTKIANRDTALAVVEYIKLMSPFVHYFDRNPDVFFFYSIASDECRNVVESAFAGKSKTEMLVSTAEMSVITSTCSNETIADFLAPSDVVQKLNASLHNAFHQHRHGSAMFDDFMEGYINASTLLVENEEVKAEQITEGLIEYYNKLRDATQAFSSSSRDLQLGDGSTRYTLFAPNVAKNYTGALLTAVPSRQCSYATVQSAHDLREAYQALRTVKASDGSTFVFDVASQGRPEYMLLCGTK